MTLAVHPNILDDIEDKGIFAEFQTLLKHDPTITDELRRAIKDLLDLARKLILTDGSPEGETCNCLHANY